MRRIVSNLLCPLSMFPPPKLKFLISIIHKYNGPPFGRVLRYCISVGLRRDRFVTCCLFVGKLFVLEKQLREKKIGCRIEMQRKKRISRGHIITLAFVGSNKAT